MNPFRSRFGALALAATCALTFSACDSDGSSGASADVTVMSRNLYLGGDLFTLVQTSEVPIPVRVAQLYATIQASNPAERMAAIAAEIDASDADVVGLQEVVKYRFQATSDYVTGTTTPNATVVTYDFLQLLVDALAARGETYVVAAQNVNSDVELPGTADGVNFFDVRLTDSDAVLVRQGVTVNGTPEAVNYAVAAPIPVGTQTGNFTRGYTHMNLSVDGTSFTFANTHLEVGGAAVQAQILQSVEFKTRLSSVTGPLVVTGDFNSDPADAGEEGTSYRQLTTGNGALTDAGAGGAVTCCQAPDLRNTSSQLSTRIDLILHRGSVTSSGVTVIGEENGDRTASGLWPSDHAGVVTTLRVTG